MKKLVLSIIITIIFATPSLAAHWFGAGAAELERSTPDFGWLFPSASTKKASPPPKPAPPPSNPKQDIIKLIKQHLELNRKQLSQIEKIHESITENKGLGTTQINKNSFFLKNPQSIYSKNQNPEILVFLKNILKEESSNDSINDARTSIDERSQYAAAIDKAVSLQAFQTTENRFNNILELVKKIDETKNLKGIAELQARIKAKLAMIQNENAKLQMVAHLRNAEQALINQQKHKRNMRILNSKNTAMPTIRLR
ncbi:type IV secretion system protein [Bartonella sp. CB175]|uniref:type IV secretion system protein n=1 Tax=Bartonella sp. CB175 TaxID=3112256 RepID=UPI00300DE64F